ncbi:hypothetical protein EVAR_82921_1 [Eumeta japonica]|uniref:Uncharacterized protein n=1 Tax=Eumeta variegata TaxID=151549 RepID=A0A4C1X4B4_EUMVA|nr:hypothetical protein EVAR_82921_1 [Eumeta japonica]
MLQVFFDKSSEKKKKEKKGIRRTKTSHRFLVMGKLCEERFMSRKRRKSHHTRELTRFRAPGLSCENGKGTRNWISGNEASRRRARRGRGSSLNHSSAVAVQIFPPTDGLVNIFRFREGRILSTARIMFLIGRLGLSPAPPPTEHKSKFATSVCKQIPARKLIRFYIHIGGYPSATLEWIPSSFTWAARAVDSDLSHGPVGDIDSDVGVYDDFGSPLTILDNRH